MRPIRLFTGLSLVAGFVPLLSSLRKIPKGVEAVKHFNPQKYLGTWYEIDRLDYRWEKGLDHVTATYSLNTDGTIKVVNKGYDVKKDKWEQSTGKAKPVS